MGIRFGEGSMDNSVQHGDPLIRIGDALCAGEAAKQQPRELIDTTLVERGNRYGEFKDQAFIAQNIKAAMGEGRNWAFLPADIKEALDMIANKISRILNGDANYVDSWHDIIGYARLIEQRLEKEIPKNGT